MAGDLRVNGGRLQDRLDRLAAIGARPDGGVCRLAFGEADKQARDWVAAHLRRLGLDVRIDRLGNLLGVRPGRDTGPIVLAGSHLDTVATGGRYDGAAGVMAGLEVLETLVEARLPTRLPLGLIVFANEEGARFTPDMMGSLVVTGRLSVDAARLRADRDGITVGQAIDGLGYAGGDELGDLPIRGYLELHVEQGPILERDGCTIGVVEAVQGIRWLAFSLRGAAAHAGATPIPVRRDAAYVAAAIVLHARALSSAIPGQRATVGALAISPNIVNVVAEAAELTVDLRNPDAGRLDEAEAAVRRFVEETAAAERVSVEGWRREVDVAPARFDAAIVALVEESARALGYRSRRLVSGAGHDAQIIAARHPAAMIFVPSRDGVSHNVHEYTAPEDLEAGANVLLRAAVSLAAGGARAAGAVPCR